MSRARTRTRSRSDAAPEEADRLLAVLEAVRTGRDAKAAKREVDRAVEAGFLGHEAAGAITSCLRLFEKVDALEAKMRRRDDDPLGVFDDLEKSTRLWDDRDDDLWEDWDDEED